LGVRTLERQMKGPVGLMSVTGIDILVDGLVLGIAFAAGAKACILLTVALTIEVLFLGLTVANELGEGGVSKWKVVGATAGLVLL
ncbi:transporter, partial [Escherichia coli]|nr:transporter [Escherichia coli]